MCLFEVSAGRLVVEYSVMHLCNMCNELFEKKQQLCQGLWEVHTGEMFVRKEQCGNICDKWILGTDVSMADGMSYH